MSSGKVKNATKQFATLSVQSSDNLQCQIDPLIGQMNWPIWRQQFYDFLWKCGPLFVEVINDQTKRGTSQDEAVKRYLKQACSSSIFDTVLKHHTTSYNMWKALESKFGPNDLREAIELRKQLANCKLTDMHKGGEWLKKMLNLYSKIVSSTKEFNMEQEFVYNVIVKVQEKTDILKYLNKEIGTYGEKYVPMTIENIFDMIRTYFGELEEQEQEESMKIYSYPCSFCYKFSHAEIDCWYAGHLGETDYSDAEQEEEQNDVLLPLPTPSTGSAPKVEICTLLIEPSKPGQPSPVSPDTWVLQTGSTNHFCCNRKYITNLRQIKPVGIMQAAAGSDSVANFQGEILLENNTRRYVLTVYYVPNWTTNTISITLLSKKFANVRTVFSDNVCTMSNGHDLLIEASHDDGPYLIRNLKAYDFSKNRLSSSNN